MLRFILNTFLILLALRFVSMIARAIGAGRRSGPRLNEEPEAPKRSTRSRVPPHSDAVDVPFTEIPPDSPP
jgi:hypothetical protein